MNEHAAKSMMQIYAKIKVYDALGISATVLKEGINSELSGKNLFDNLTMIPDVDFNHIVKVQESISTKIEFKEENNQLASILKTYASRTKIAYSLNEIENLETISIQDLFLELFGIWSVFTMTSNYDTNISSTDIQIFSLYDIVIDINKKELISCIQECLRIFVCVIAVNYFQMYSTNWVNEGCVKQVPNYILEDLTTLLFIPKFKLIPISKESFHSLYLPNNDIRKDFITFIYLLLPSNFQNKIELYQFDETLLLNTDWIDKYYPNFKIALSVMNHLSSEMFPEIVKRKEQNYLYYDSWDIVNNTNNNDTTNDNSIYKSWRIEGDQNYELTTEDNFTFINNVTMPDMLNLDDNVIFDCSNRNAPYSDDVIFVLSEMFPGLDKVNIKKLTKNKEMTDEDMTQFNDEYRKFKLQMYSSSVNEQDILVPPISNELDNQILVNQSLKALTDQEIINQSIEENLDYKIWNINVIDPIEKEKLEILKRQREEQIKNKMLRYEASTSDSAKNRKEKTYIKEKISADDKIEIIYIKYVKNNLKTYLLSQPKLEEIPKLLESNDQRIKTIKTIIPNFNSINNFNTSAGTLAPILRSSLYLTEEGFKNLLDRKFSTLEEKYKEKMLDFAVSWLDTQIDEKTPGMFQNITFEFRIVLLIDYFLKNDKSKRIDLKFDPSSSIIQINHIDFNINSTKLVSFFGFPKNLIINAHIWYTIWLRLMKFCKLIVIPELGLFIPQEVQIIHTNGEMKIITKNQFFIKNLENTDEDKYEYISKRRKIEKNMNINSKKFSYVVVNYQDLLEETQQNDEKIQALLDMGSKYGDIESYLNNNANEDNLNTYYLSLVQEFRNSQTMFTSVFTKDIKNEYKNILTLLNLLLGSTSKQNRSNWKRDMDLLKLNLSLEEFKESESFYYSFLNKKNQLLFDLQDFSRGESLKRNNIEIFLYVFRSDGRLIEKDMELPENYATYYSSVEHTINNFKYNKQWDKNKMPLSGYVFLLTNKVFSYSLPFVKKIKFYPTIATLKQSASYKPLVACCKILSVFNRFGNFQIIKNYNDFYSITKTNLPVLTGNEYLGLLDPQTYCIVKDSIVYMMDVGYNETIRGDNRSELSWFSKQSNHMLPINPIAIFYVEPTSLDYIIDNFKSVDLYLNDIYKKTILEKDDSFEKQQIVKSYKSPSIVPLIVQKREKTESISNFDDGTGIDCTLKYMVDFNYYYRYTQSTTVVEDGMVLFAVTIPCNDGNKKYHTCEIYHRGSKNVGTIAIIDQQYKNEKKKNTIFHFNELKHFIKSFNSEDKTLYDVKECSMKIDQNEEYGKNHGDKDNFIKKVKSIVNFSQNKKMNLLDKKHGYGNCNPHDDNNNIHGDKYQPRKSISISNFDCLSFYELVDIACSSQNYTITQLKINKLKEIYAKNIENEEKKILKSLIHKNPEFSKLFIKDFSATVPQGFETENVSLPYTPLTELGHNTIKVLLNNHVNMSLINKSFSKGTLGLLTTEDQWMNGTVTAKSPLLGKMEYTYGNTFAYLNLISLTNEFADKERVVYKPKSTSYLDLISDKLYYTNKSVFFKKHMYEANKILSIIKELSKLNIDNISFQEMDKEDIMYMSAKTLQEGYQDNIIKKTNPYQMSLFDMLESQIQDKSAYEDMIRILKVFYHTPKIFTPIDNVIRCHYTYLRDAFIEAYQWEPIENRSKILETILDIYTKEDEIIPQCIINMLLHTLTCSTNSIRASLSEQKAEVEKTLKITYSQLKEWEELIEFGKDSDKIKEFEEKYIELTDELKTLYSAYEKIEKEEKTIYIGLINKYNKILITLGLQPVSVCTDINDELSFEEWLENNQIPYVKIITEENTDYSLLFSNSIDFWVEIKTGNSIFYNTTRNSMCYPMIVKNMDIYYPSFNPKGMFNFDYEFNNIFQLKMLLKMLMKIQRLSNVLTRQEDVKMTIII